MIPVEAVDFLRLSREPYPTVLSDQRATFRFHQPVVVGLPRPRFGLFGQKFVEPLRHGVVDKITADVGDTRECETETAPT